jgi:tetratricopeptide (TPR) repeat protein
LFGRALEAARELDDPWATAPTLLMAGWAPYWKWDLDKARSMFEEALAISRSNPDGDPWGEARALTALASVISPVGDEQECLVLAQEALAIGRRSRDPFTIAVAQQYVANSLRRMWRLGEAMEAVQESVRLFRELGARWELASALGDQANVHWLSERVREAEAGFRRALDLCQELGERSLTAWTASRLMAVLLAQGRREDAMRVLEEPNTHLRTGGLESRVSTLWADLILALYDGDEEHARNPAAEMLDLERRTGWPNAAASTTWWVASLLATDMAGGESVVEEARQTLEKAHWLQSLHEPELVKRLILRKAREPDAD